MKKQTFARELVSGHQPLYVLRPASFASLVFKHVNKEAKLSSTATVCGKLTLGSILF